MAIAPVKKFLQALPVAWTRSVERLDHEGLMSLLGELREGRVAGHVLVDRLNAHPTSVPPEAILAHYAWRLHPDYESVHRVARPRQPIKHLVGDRTYNHILVGPRQDPARRTRFIYLAKIAQEGCHSLTDFNRDYW